MRFFEADVGKNNDKYLKCSPGSFFRASIPGSKPTISSISQSGHKNTDNPPHFFKLSPHQFYSDSCQEGPDTDVPSVLMLGGRTGDNGIGRLINSRLIGMFSLDVNVSFDVNSTCSSADPDGGVNIFLQ